MAKSRPEQEKTEAVQANPGLRMVAARPPAYLRTIPSMGTTVGIGHRLTIVADALALDPHAEAVQRDVRACTEEIIARH